MISSRRRQLSIVLIVAWLCVPVLSQEPNQPKPALQFETSQEQKEWVQTNAEPGRGPIKPEYAAEFALYKRASSRSVDLNISSHHLERLLETMTGQSFSQTQRDFLMGSDASAVIDIGHIVRRHNTVRLYATSEDDARKMTELFIEALANKARERMQNYENQVRELEEKIAETKNKIAKAEEELKDAQPDFDSFRKNVHYRDHLQAEETLSGFNKMLNTLNIELSGIRARLTTIEIFQAKERAEDYALLERLYIEQTIELRAAEAKVNTINPLRYEARKFVKLSRRLQAAESNKHNLGNDLKRYEDKLHPLEQRLTDLRPQMLPKVFQNKVTIYPVRVDD